MVVHGRQGHQGDHKVGPQVAQIDLLEVALDRILPRAGAEKVDLPVLAEQGLDVGKAALAEGQTKDLHPALLVGSDVPGEPRRAFVIAAARKEHDGDETQDGGGQDGEDELAVHGVSLSKS
jgi:hypothetical protein